MGETMRGIEIRDGIAATGGLNFDLAEVLAALGEAVRNSIWRCRGLWYVSSDERDIPEFEGPENEELVLSGDQLLEGTVRLLQVIDGEFEATRPGEHAPWLLVRAIDSSWWEVRSNDPEALAAIRARFSELQEIAPGAA